MKALYYDKLKSYQGIKLENFQLPQNTRLERRLMILSIIAEEKAQIERTDDSGPLLFFARLATRRGLWPLRETLLASILCFLILSV